mmetsp:Transcript_15020/g.28415  ORF Transcript_15020/g.28415 Transcript_15020/m.28415 type:complete len:91 (+) Transcript_15020:215-487(+)
MKTNIQFHNPYVLTRDAVLKMATSRWHKVQRPDMREIGCKYFAWILPGEPIGGHPNPYGAFAYLFHEPNIQRPTEEQLAANRFFPIISNV